jgi:hypothetical protein
MTACENTSNRVTEHFLPMSVNIKQAGRPQENFELSRFACYLIAMNGDPRKQEIAMAQSYFAIKTREAEVAIPIQIDRIKELELELAIKNAEVQVFQAQENLLRTRHFVTTTCPEPIQQKILGYQVVEKIEYRDRVIKDDEIINDGSCATKTDLCNRYGILTRNGKPDFKRLNAMLEKSPIGNKDDAWRVSVQFQENKLLAREYLPELDRWFEQTDRQLWVGE